MRPLALLLIPACTTPTALSLPFQANVGGDPFACGTAFTGLGPSGATGTFTDARLYVHAIEPLDADGEPLPFTLDDNTNQGQGVVLLDFEDDSESCQTGSPSVYTTITGAVTGDPVRIRFTVGVPSDLNHLDNATAKAPLNAPGMWWSWSGGYKYLKIDLTTAVHPDFFFHLGATDCDGTPGSGFSCAWGNTATVELSPDTPIQLDLAALYAGLDLSQPPAETDTTPGCMSFPGDPSCPPMFGALGLGFEDAPAPDAQTLFFQDATL